MSTESVRELIVAYNNKGWGNKKWKSAEDMVRSIESSPATHVSTTTDIRGLTSSTTRGSPFPPPKILSAAETPKGFSAASVLSQGKRK